MFRGQFLHSIDSKGRVSIPARFRDVLAKEQNSRLIVTPAPFDPCLHVYPLSAWQDLECKIAELSSLDPNIVRLRRIYISAAIECDPDRVGRILVPNHLRESASLGKDALWAGTGRFAELWSKERWDVAIQIDEDQFEAFRKAVVETVRI